MTILAKFVLLGAPVHVLSKACLYEIKQYYTGAYTKMGDLIRRDHILVPPLTETDSKGVCSSDGEWKKCSKPGDLGTEEKICLTVKDEDHAVGEYHKPSPMRDQAEMNAELTLYGSLGKHWDLVRLDQALLLKHPELEELELKSCEKVVTSGLSDKFCYFGKSKRSSVGANWLLQRIEKTGGDGDINNHYAGGEYKRMDKVCFNLVCTQHKIQNSGRSSFEWKVQKKPDEIAQLQKKLKEVEQQNKELQTGVTQLQGQLEDQKTELIETGKQLEVNLAEKEAQLKAKLQEQEDKNAELEAELQNGEKEKTKLKKELEGQAKKEADLKKELEGQAKKEAELKETLVGQGNLLTMLKWGQERQEKLLETIGDHGQASTWDTSSMVSESHGERHGVNEVSPRLTNILTLGSEESESSPRKVANDRDDVVVNKRKQPIIINNTKFQKKLAFRQGIA
jgi:hypothetical protein